MVKSRPAKSHRSKRRGVALLLTVFVSAVASLILLGLLQSSRSQVSALQNTVDYERAQNLAGAGVHHAIAQLQQKPNFKGSIKSTQFPRRSGFFYSATVEEVAPDTMLITGEGRSGAVTRRIQVTVRK